MKRIIVSTIALATLSGAAYAQNVKDLEKRIEDLELSRDLNIFNFSGELENNYVNHNSTNKTTKQGAGKDFYSMYLKLNMEASPSEKMTFFGRLSMSKVFNAFSVRSTSGGVVSDSGTGGKNLDGSKLYVERAFMNYSLSKNLVFSAGRMPTIEGPPNHVSKGAARSGTYPQLAYGSILDGIALSHTMTFLGGNLSSRAVWTPVNFQNKNSDTLDTNATDSKGVKIDTTTPMTSLMLDYERTAQSWAEKINLIAQLLTLKDFYINSSAAKCSTAAPGGYDNPCTASGVTESSNLKFDYNAIVLYSEFSNVFSSGLDFSFSWKHTDVDSKGSLSTLKTLGMLTSQTQESKKGQTYLASLRYSFLKKYKIGYEWIKSTKSSFSAGIGSFDPISFYSVPASEGHHVFMTADIDSNLRLIAGYQLLEISHKYTSLVIGAGEKVDLERSAGYLRLIANF